MGTLHTCVSSADNRNSKHKQVVRSDKCMSSTDNTLGCSYHGPHNAPMVTRLSHDHMMYVSLQCEQWVCPKALGQSMAGSCWSLPCRIAAVCPWGGSMLQVGCRGETRAQYSSTHHFSFILWYCDVSVLSTVWVHLHTHLPPLPFIIHTSTPLHHPHLPSPSPPLIHTSPPPPTPPPWDKERAT